MLLYKILILFHFTLAFLKNSDEYQFTNINCLSKISQYIYICI